jgi:hypothetical protein
MFFRDVFCLNQGNEIATLAKAGKVCTPGSR